MTGDTSRGPTPLAATPADPAGESGAGREGQTGTPRMKLHGETATTAAAAAVTTDGRPARPESGAGPTDAADDALVQRLRCGDLAAGDALVTRYHAALIRYLQRLVGAEAAEELHQQTWLSVLDNLDRFEPGVGASAAGGSRSDRSGSAESAATVSGGFKAWLFRIATNKANDLWRSRGREKAAREGLKLITDGTLPGAAHGLEGTEQDVKLRKAIDRLPENQRQVLMLRYYSNLKFVEIAEILGCPLNTALGRVHKAVLKLRQVMQE